MSKKWPFKKSPGVVVTALIEDVEDLQDRITFLEKRLDETNRYVTIHCHSTYPPGLDDDLDDIGPVL